MSTREEPRDKRSPDAAIPVSCRAPGSEMAAAVVGPSMLDEIRRHEFGVETFCQLVVDLSDLMDRGQGEAPVPQEFCEKFTGITLLAWNEPLPRDLSAIAYPSRTRRMLWMSLDQILELAEHLWRDHSRERWRTVFETVETWKDGWGSDSRATYARLRFSTLTGLVQGKREKSAFLIRSLAQALSAVQA